MRAMIIYRKMDVTRQCINQILTLREILLSFQTGLNLVNAAVTCAILESISGLELSSVITGAQVFEACDCLKLLCIHFDLCVDATGVVCHQLGLFGTDLYAGGCGGFVEMLNDILPVLLPLLLSNLCHQQSGDW